MFRPARFPFQSTDPALTLGRTGPALCFPRFRLTPQQRLTHMHVLGITNQGKSKLLESCLFQDITHGRGCALLDPHTDLASDLLALLKTTGFLDEAQHRARIIYFDPTRSDYLIPFNVLASTCTPYVTAVNVVEAFRRTWPESLREAPRFSNILLASLLALIANQFTLVELPRFLTDTAFREELLSRVGDPEVVSVFHDRVDKWGREKALILESILNKVSAFTLNPTLRLILGQRENHLDFRRMMDEGKVFIADLGRCDAETRRLLGSLIVTGVEQAALSRKDAPSRLRRPFYFYIDEFQDFSANEGSAMTFAQILSEARKFGLHLTLAHQTLGQMTSERMRAALGNIGIKVVFAVDREDAEVMAKKLFVVAGENVKHEVENETSQEKTHPVFYSLGEEWEKATQAIQNLRPRTAFVKAPPQRFLFWTYNGVAKIYTITLPAAQLSEADLEQVRLALIKNIALPIDPLRTQLKKQRGREERVELADFEPIQPQKRLRLSDCHR